MLQGLKHREATIAGISAPGVKTREATIVGIRAPGVKHGEATIVGIRAPGVNLTSASRFAPRSKPCRDVPILHKTRFNIALGSERDSVIFIDIQCSCAFSHVV